MTRRSRESGFSLVEMTMVIVLTSILAISILLFTKPVVDLYALQTFQHGAATETRLALLRMCREINSVRDRASIATANSTALTFTNTSNTSVAFSLSGATLQRDSSALAKNITSFTITYYNSSNATISTPVVSPSQTDIRRVGITATTTVGSRSETRRCQAQPRNLY